MRIDTPITGERIAGPESVPDDSWRPALTLDNNRVPDRKVANGCSEIQGSNRESGFLILGSLVTVLLSLLICVRLATTLAWRTDEIPLLVRGTGACGQVSNETEAVAFRPSVHTFWTGALRSLRPPTSVSSIHTTTGFWVNLTIHLFELSPLTARVMPLNWTLLGTVAVGIAAGLLTRNRTAGCLAAAVHLLSPTVVGYAAQARGYAECMALTSVLLLTVEWFRRHPQGILRAVLLFWCALQLSMTVYTAWVYFVLPVLLMIPFLIPSALDSGRAFPRGRFGARQTLTLIAISMMACVGLYTVDRWSSLAFTAGTMGIAVTSVDSILSLIRLLGETFPPRFSPFMMLPVLGLAVIFRSSSRWWGWCIVLGLLCPIGFALVQGSLGYPRNLAYWWPLSAILCGVGWHAADRVVGARYASRGRRILSGAIIVGLVWSLGGLEARARGALGPDWGGVAKGFSDSSSSRAARWFCPCLANHWSLLWYDHAPARQAVLAVEPGATIEVVLGAERDEFGVPRLYYEDSERAAILPLPLPDEISRGSTSRIQGGVVLWSWTGTRVVDLETLDGLVLVLIIQDRPDGDAWPRVLTALNSNADPTITFKPVSVNGVSVRSLLATARTWRAAAETVTHLLQVPSDHIRCFGLSKSGGGHGGS